MEPSTPPVYPNDEPCEADLDAECNEKVIRAFVALIAWITDQGKASEQTAGRRSYVVAWSLLEHLKVLDQKEMARLLRLNHKQAFGRHVTEYGNKFGKMIAPHQHTSKASEACRKREERKRRMEERETVEEHESEL